MMRKRDRDILADLDRFRCMSRDDIAELHFSNLKNKENACNNVMKRLVRDGYAEVNIKHVPYLYFPSPAPIKKDSSKIKHFLAIIDFYKQIRKYQEPRLLKIEPKYKKDYMEPDIFMIWQKAPFFVEIQCSIYSEKVMKAKLKRYQDYFYSEEWKKELWQPKEKKVFPYLWIVTDTRYNVEDYSFPIFQTSNVMEFLKLAG